MIDLYYWPTPNGHKITMFLEESGLDFRLFPINIGKGEQFGPEFLAIAPNNRIPAIVDRAPADGGAPVTIFESGAILLYLAEKTGRFIPTGVRGRFECLQWLFWQMAGLGPMAGQFNHFRHYATEKIPYAIERYGNETGRLYAVLNRQLRARDFICGGAYTIADMACYPWVLPERQEQNMAEFPDLARWKAAIAARPATVRAYERGTGLNPRPGIHTDEERKVLFGQNKTTVR